MNKEVLEKLLQISKETSPQDLWDQVKKIEEAIGGSLEEVENLEDLLVAMISEEAAEVEDDKSFDYEQAAEVAKAKGLFPVEGDLVKKRLGLQFANKSVDTVAIKGAKGKSKGEDYFPTPEELALINKYTNVDFAKEEVMVFSLVSADQNVDRAGDQFTSKGLKDMADMSPDKPYLMNHDWEIGSVMGKIFDAKVANKQLQQKVYVPIRENTKDFIQGMLDGLYNKVSVGFAMNPKDYVCSSCQKSLYSMECSHYPGGKDKEGKPIIGIIRGVKDYFEISNVAVPCQPAAGIRRSTEQYEPELVKSVVANIDAFDFQKLVQEGLDRAFGKDNPQAATTFPVVKSLDKILDETNPNGEAPVPEVNKEAEAPAEEVKEVVEEAAPATEEVVEEVVEEKAVEPAVDPLKAMVKELGATIAAEIASSLKEVIAELKATVQEKVEADKSVEDESTEEIARKLAKSSIESSTSNPADPAPDYSKSGWAAYLVKAVSNQPK